MSQLQIWLAIAGGVVLIVLVAHNAWNNRKNQPRQADPLITEAEREALVGTMGNHMGTSGSFDDSRHPTEGRSEPGFDDHTSDAAELTDDNPQVQALDARLQASVSRPILLLDALIDVIATMELDSPISGDAALAALPPTRRVGSKAMILEGLHVESGEYEAVRAGQRYSAFQMGIQLANRQGALNDLEFSEFVVKTSAFAEAMGTTPEFPDMLEVISHARELDHFASGCDAQLSFTLQALRSAWSTGYVQQCAARMGFVPGVIPGRMVIAASQPGLPPVLVLQFDTRAAMTDDPASSPIRRFALSLDVPQVSQDEQPFQRLCEVAMAMAKDMEGQITDDQGQVVTIQAMARIHHELEALYGTLAERDIPAGSPQARRLFS